MNFHSVVCSSGVVVVVVIDNSNSNLAIVTISNNRIIE